MNERIDHPIIGAWRLLSWRIEYEDGRLSALPFGDRPEGLLIYNEDGWMSATICRAARERFPADLSPRSLSDGTIARAYHSFFHYSGRFRIEDGNVIHTVLHSLNPNMVGTEQHREMTLIGSELTLTAIERLISGSRHHLISWRRADQFSENQ